MVYPESEFVDVINLAYQFDMSRDGIKNALKELLQQGHSIECLRWGKQGKLKIHAKQFRIAVMREWKATAEEAVELRRIARAAVNTLTS